MSLFGANKKKDSFQKAKERMYKFLSKSSSAGTDESSHIGELIKEREGPLPTDPDGTATTSEIAREELGDYQGVQPAAVILTREQFNQGVRIHNAEVRAEGHPSQAIEPIWATAQVIDEYGNRRPPAVLTISSDNSSLSPPPTASYGGSEISFPSRTPGERVLSPPQSTNYEGSLMGLPPSAIPQNPFPTPRASAGIIARRYIQSEENASQHAEQEGGMKETRRVDTPIRRQFEVRDSSDNKDDMMTEVEWRNEEPYMTPTKKGKKRNEGKGVKRPVTPDQPIPNMPQMPSRKRLDVDWAKPAESLTSENEPEDLGKFIGEYLRNTNGLRDFMVGQERNDASYDIWCQQQSQHIAARQNHTDVAVMSVRKIAQAVQTDAELERECAAERAEKLDEGLSKIEKRSVKIALVNMAKTIENAMKNCMEEMIDQLTDRVVKRVEDAAEESKKKGGNPNGETGRSHP